MLILRVCLAITVVLTVSAPQSAFAVSTDTIRDSLRNRLESVDTGSELTVGGDRILAVITLRDFFERRAFAPAWSADGSPTTAAGRLLIEIKNAAADGLRSWDYHRQAIADHLAMQRPLTKGQQVDLELLLTDAFLLLASHHLAGRLDPERIDPEWRANRRGRDLAAVLEQAIGTGSVQAALNDQMPPQEGYRKLRAALAQYRRLAVGGGWPSVSDGPKLEPGATGPRVDEVAARLGITVENGVYDDALRGALVAFQARHGLDTDGVVGAKTVAALNMPVESRIRQLEVNLERWRWLPQDLGRRHVLVNIAGFHLEAVEPGREPLDMRVIVGKGYRRTPVFSDLMTYMVLNPSWEVPQKIASQDILPQIKKDPGIFSVKGFTLLSGWGADAREIDPGTVEWTRIPAGTFPYRLRQKPGPLNALGRVKFMFPNAFNVYLHDTPARELFVKSERTFSSGCIRIEQPLELAAWLLQGQEGWNREALDASLTDGREKTVRLATPAAVHLLYWTAWIDDDGVLQFRNDIYGRDQRVEDALNEQPPSPGDTQS